MQAPDYFLGGYFERVKNPNTDNEILKWGSKTYSKRPMEKIKNTFVFEDYKQHFAMTPEYNTDLDTNQLCTDTDNAQ